MPYIATLSAEFGKEGDISCRETDGKIQTSHTGCGFWNGRRADIIVFSARFRNTEEGEHIIVLYRYKKADIDISEISLERGRRPDMINLGHYFRQLRA
jgi:hypothetical protein